jgi:geranylgeranyl diphosphate synthase type II
LYSKYKKLVDQELKRIFSSIRKDVKTKALPKILYDAMYYSVFNGGKRIRPILCLATYDAVKTKKSSTKYQDVLPFACGIELIHTFSLIQDDLPSMDNDDRRRGKPTLHKAFDEGVALLAADALFALSFELFATARIDEKRKNRAVIELSRISGRNGLVAGQVLDIINQKAISKHQKIIDEKKTAQLIAGAMKIGATVAGANDKIIKKIEKTGIYLGLLFQVTDDILDIKDAKVRENLQTQAIGYSRQTKGLFSKLGTEFNWFILFADYILNRKA